MSFKANLNVKITSACSWHCFALIMLVAHVASPVDSACCTLLAANTHGKTGHATGCTNKALILISKSVQVVGHCLGQGDAFAEKLGSQEDMKASQMLELPIFLQASSGTARTLT